MTIAARARRVAPSGPTIFAAAIDATNWAGFSIEGDRLSMESHTAGKVTAHAIDYSPSRHRFLRLRVSRAAALLTWETSADGKDWNPGYVETPPIGLDSLHIALCAGTIDSISVEQRP